VLVVDEPERRGRQHRAEGGAVGAEFARDEVAGEDGAVVGRDGEGERVAREADAKVRAV
jgi:hypothetical protein